MTDLAVVGAGTMGHALALVFALGGHRVRLTDTDPAALERAPALIQTALATLREGGEVDPAWTPERVGQLIRCEAELGAAVAGAELVVEAITEQPDAKRALFAQLDALVAPPTIIASNTSYLDVFPLIPERRQARALIAHWYTPPYLVDLVDLVAGPHTDPAVVERVRALVTALGKHPIVLRRFVPGYIANRIQSAIALEVYALLDDGVADVAEIDAAIIHGLALRIPVLAHFMKADFTGLPLVRDTLANRSYAPPPVRGRCDTLERRVAEGRTGVMAGRGFYDWGGRPPAELFRERDRKLIALRQALRRIGPMAPSQTA